MSHASQSRVCFFEALEAVNSHHLSGLLQLGPYSSMKLNNETNSGAKKKHAEAARLDYTTTHRHIDTNMNKDRPASKLKLGHTRESERG
jgi:hypothetical protein